MTPQPGHKLHVRPKDLGRPRRRPVEQVLAEVLETVFAGQAGPVTIAIGGPGGTGKSTLARRLSSRLGGAPVLTLDDYKTARAARRQTGIYGPHPGANKMDLIAEHLALLRQGGAFDKPVYDPAAGDALSAEPFCAGRFTIVEGEVATYPHFRDLIDFSVFIDSDWRTQLATRLGRDLGRRNYSPEKAVATFLHSNLREFAEHGAEGKHWADVHLFCHGDYRLELESVSQALFERAHLLLHNELSAVELTGLVVPLPSPFDGTGALARRAFAEHLDVLTAAGVRRVLVGGTTGEFFSLTSAERLDLLKLALEYFPGLTLFQAGGGPLPETLRLSREAQALGADAIVCLPPVYYADAPVEGVVAYLRAVAEAIDIPLMLYNFPRHTQNPLTPALLQQVPHYGLKDSSGDLSLAGATPRYFAGNDARIVAALQTGAAGFVNTAANVAPEACLALERHAAEGRWAEAATLQDGITRLAQSLGGYETAVIKHLVHRRLAGYPTAVRPPLVSPPPARTLRAAEAACDALTGLAPDGERWA